MTILFPAFFFGIRTRGQAVNNFFIEYQRPTNQTRKKIRRKLLNYFMFWKYRIYKADTVVSDYPDIEDWQTMRVLVVTIPETSTQEHERLIQTARTIDEHGKGLRLFWFSKLGGFKLNRPDSFFSKAWQTPADRENHFNSLLD
jgi:hypothetical protein